MPTDEIQEMRDSYEKERQKGMERAVQRLAAMPDSPIENPYWESVKDLPLSDLYSHGGQVSFARWNRRIPVKFDDLDSPESQASNKDFVENFMKRDRAAVKWSWSIPDPTVLQFIVDTLNGRSLVEIGAGTGYWAWMLTQMGVKVNAYDIAPPKEGQNAYHSNASGNREPDTEWDSQWFDVQEGDHRKLRLPCNRDRVLFLSWPPYRGDDEDDMGAQSLTSFKGDTVIYIGEGDGGCTGTKEFHQLLEDQWDQVDFYSLCQWEGIHDNLYVYTRKPRKKPNLP